MPYAQIDDGIELYYELTGPDDGPVVIQFGGGLFGRHNFGFVNDGFRERGFRLLSFDARGYGASTSPREWYTIEGWADDGAKLLDALSPRPRPRPRHVDGRDDRDRLHRDARRSRRSRRAPTSRSRSPTSTGATLFRVWRRMAESMPWDDFSDHVTTQAVGAAFLESEAGKDTFATVRSVIGVNDPYTVRQACLAMEQMDLSPLVPAIDRPLLMTNGTHDILCPPVLAPSGLGARRMAEMNASTSRRTSSPTSATPTSSSAPRRPCRSSPRSSRLRCRAPTPAEPRSRQCSGFVPAIQMITRLNFPSASKSKKLQLCMSFCEPSFSSPM